MGQCSDGVDLSSLLLRSSQCNYGLDNVDNSDPDARVLHLRAELQGEVGLGHSQLDLPPGYRGVDLLDFGCWIHLVQPAAGRR